MSGVFGSSCPLPCSAAPTGLTRMGAWTASALRPLNSPGARRTALYTALLPRVTRTSLNGLPAILGTRFQRLMYIDELLTQISNRPGACA